MNALYLIAGAAGLYFGAEWLIRGSASLGLRYGLPKAVVGLTIIGFGTSAPELIVSLQAGLDGEGAISLGNVVGSNISNIGLIVGISLLIRPLHFSSSLGYADGLVMVLSALLLPAVMQAFGLTQKVGLLFLAALCAYTFLTLYRSRKKFTGQEVDEAGNPKLPVWKDLLYIMAGLLALIGSARLFLSGAIGMASYWGLSEAVIGLTVVAVGTSLPELAASVVAACRNHGDIALGNIVGSNIYNILGILGVVGVISPIVQSELTVVDYGVMIAYTLVFYGMLRMGKTAGRLSGALLLGAYVLYTYYLYRP